MNKKGFGLIEILIVVVILSVSLLTLFSTYSKIDSSERAKMCRDDIDYVFRLNYLKNLILDFTPISNYLNNNIKVKNQNASEADDTLSVKIEEDNVLFDDNTILELFNNYKTFVKADFIYVLKPDYNIIPLCKNSVLEGNKGSLTTKEYNTCLNTFSSMDYETIDYVRSLGYNNFSKNYIIIAGYNTYFESSGYDYATSEICKNQRGYAWLDMEIPYD